MPSELAVLEEYTNLGQAEVIRAMLEASGIDAIIAKDDAGGMAPSLQVFAGVRILVRAEDLEMAEKLLEAEPVESPDSDAPDTNASE